MQTEVQIERSQHRRNRNSNNHKPPLGIQILLVLNVLAHHQLIISAVPTRNKLPEGEQKPARHKDSRKNFHEIIIVSINPAGKKQQAVKKKHYTYQDCLSR